MRNLNKDEKRIVEKFFLNKETVNNIIENEINKDTYLKMENGEIKIKFSKDQINKAYETLNKILTVTKLIELLEENGYLMCVKIGTNFKNNYTIGKFNNSYNQELIFFDHKLKRSLTEYVPQTLYATEDLRRFIKGSVFKLDFKFLTDQQRHHIQILGMWFLAILIQAVLGIVGVYYQNQINDKDKIEILEKRLNNNTTKLDSLAQNP